MLDAPAPPPAGACEDRRRIFLEFMTRVARFEELADAGKRFVARFHQGLEYFRRPRVPNGSDVVSEIVRSNCTDRLKSYLEAGCSLHCLNISNLNKLKDLLKELQCLVEDAIDTTLTANLSALKLPYNPTVDNKMNNESLFMEEKEQQPGDQLDSDSSLVTVMILVHNMLKLDYMMQENIVRALSLKSSSPELEGYCLMWELRPYVDDDVMDLAWKMCP